MFYDNRLMNSNSIGKVWKAANNLDYDSDEEDSVPIICDQLNSWVGSDHEEAHRRLSLRTSSILIDGAARLYKRKIQQLFDDVAKLDTEMIFRKKLHRSIRRGTENGKSNTTHSTAIENLEQLFYHNSNENSNFSNNRCLDQNAIQDLNNNPSLRVNKSVQTSPIGKSLSIPAVNHNGADFNENLPFGFVVIHDSYNSRIPSKIIFSSLNIDVTKLN